MPQYVKISVSELANLIRCENKLSALECGGVDNWSWYSDSMWEYARIAAENMVGMSVDEVYELMFEPNSEEVLKRYPIVD